MLLALRLFVFGLGLGAARSLTLAAGEEGGVLGGSFFEIEGVEAGFVE